MNINLRFAMHRDIPLIHSQKDKVDGLVIPAHILAYQSAPTSVFVASMPGHDYIIDPMTFVFQHSKRDNSNEAGELRRSIRRMCEEYHEDLAGTLDSLDINDTMTANDFPPLHNFCEGVILFQRNAVQDKSTTSKAAKYIKRYSKQTQTQPRLIVAPYFKFDAVGDEWYRFSLECARECVEMWNQDSLAVVIYCSANSLNSSNIGQIEKDYSKFDYILIWLDNFNELAINQHNIIEARRLINVLAGSGAKVESLYGGYLMMLMRVEGMSAISHGILYTQHKSFAMLPGGGGAPERYYIPKFRAFRSLSQTDLIFHQHPELICTCNVCTTTMQGDPDRIIMFGDEPDLLRKHFMTVRREEAELVENMNREEEIERLRQTYQDYNASVSRLPNPDAFISQSRMRGLEYLNTWSEGLELAI